MRFAPEGDSTIHTQGGENELLQVWPLVLAIAMGNRKGRRLLLRVLLVLRREIIPIDAHRGRIEVHIAFVEVKDLISPYRTGREHLHRARIIEPI